MCLAIPGRILEKYDDENGLPMARVDYSGAVAAACLSFSPEAAVGEHVLVHAGMALQVLSPEEAAASLAELSRLAALMEHDDGRSAP